MPLCMLPLIAFNFRCVQGKPYMVPDSLDARKYQWFDMDWPVRPKASSVL